MDAIIALIKQYPEASLLGGLAIAFGLMVRSATILAIKTKTPTRK